MTVRHNVSPKYLGMTLDRTLSYKKHLEITKMKVRSRINLLQKLAGTGWRSNGQTLRIAALALVYSTAEYCAPVWLNSSHTDKIDIQLNSAMRIITGCLKPTPLPWPPVLANIIPPEARRKEALVNIVRKHEGTNNSMLSLMIKTIPKVRLKFRKPSYITGKALLNSDFRGSVNWSKEWGNVRLGNSELISNPSIPLAGVSLPRQDWVTLNRLRTGVGRCGQLMHRWHLKDNPACDCGECQQLITLSWTARKGNSKDK